MQEGDFSILELDASNILSFEVYLPEDRLEDIREDTTKALGLVLDSSVACGAVMYTATPEEKACVLESICVDESLRKKGHGRRLYQAFEEKAESEGMTEARARIYLPAEDDAKAFFLSMGFDRSEEGEWIFDLKSEKQIDQFMAMQEKRADEEDAVGDYRICVVSQLHEDLKKRLPKVSYSEELSFVLLVNRTLYAYLLAARDEEGNIIVLSFGTGSQKAELLYPLFEHALKSYKTMLKNGGTIYLAAVLELQKSFISSWQVDDLNYSYALELSKSIGEDIPETFTILPGSMLIPRIQGLSAILEDFGKGYEHIVYTDPEDAWIELIREEGKRSVSLHYQLDEPETAEGFRLSVLSAISLKDLSEEEAEKIRQWRSESTLVSFIEDPDGLLIIRAVILENRGLVDPALLREVLDGFMDELDHLCALDRMA